MGQSAVLQDPDGYYAKCEEEQSALRQKLVDATRRLKSVQMDPDVRDSLCLLHHLWCEGVHWWVAVGSAAHLD